MADSKLVLNDVLCYIVNKFAVSPAKIIKTAVMDFYTAEALGDAKVCLYNDINSLNLDQQLPHIAQRRCGDGRLVNEVNDIFTLLTFADEVKALDKLPKYVSGSPDGIHSLRLYEGDLQVLMTILQSLSGKMDGFEAGLAAITRDVQAIQAWPSLPEPAASRSSGQMSQPRRQQQQPQAAATESYRSRLGYNTGSVPAVSGRSADVIQSPLQPLLPSGMDWSSQTSTPIAQSNRFTILSTEDEQDHDGAYTTVQRANKRARQQSQPSSTLPHYRYLSYNNDNNSSSSSSSVGNQPPTVDLRGLCTASPPRCLILLQQRN